MRPRTRRRVKTVAVTSRQSSPAATRISAGRDARGQRPPGGRGRPAGRSETEGAARAGRRVLVGVDLRGRHAVAAHKTVTLVVDGSPMTMSTMKSRVIDVVRDNGFAVGDHDDLYPTANQPIHQSDTIVLRRGRPLQVSVDGQQSRQVWTTALRRRRSQAAVDERRRTGCRRLAGADRRWPARRCRWSARRTYTSSTAVSPATGAWRRST